MTGSGLPDVAEGRWRVLWRHAHASDPDGITVEAGAIAVLPGEEPVVVVTEEWNNRIMGLLRCDNTEFYRLSDGVKDESAWISFKRPFETPRIDVCDVGGMPIAVINTGRGVICYTRHPQLTLSNGLGSKEWHALDLVAGQFGDRPVAAVTWNEPLDDSGLHVQVYDLSTGEAYSDPWQLPRACDWNFPDTWRLGRWNGRPVAAMADDWCLYVHSGATGDREATIVLHDDWSQDGHRFGLLTIDDSAGPTLALIGQNDGAVYCYEPAAEDLYCPPLSGYSGTLAGARLGRWRDHPTAALLTNTGISLYNLQAPDRTCHIDLDLPVHDIAFTANDRIALVTASGPMLIEILP